MGLFNKGDDRFVEFIVDAPKNIFLGTIYVEREGTFVHCSFAKEFKNCTILVQARDGKWYPQKRAGIYTIGDEKTTFARCVFGDETGHGKYHVVAVAAHVQDPVTVLPEGVPHSKVVAVHRKK